MIFGSTAIRHWFTDFRSPKDLDVMSPSGWMSETEQHYWADSFGQIIESNKDPIYLDPDMLLTIKMSHAGWDIHWEKTMHDILFLKKRGAKCNKLLYELLVKDWIKIHGKAWASMKNKDSDSFFEDAVKRKYIHDDIHEAIAYEDEPMYFKILKNRDSGSVMCSKEKFYGLTNEQRIHLVMEEVWVTALERYLIPNDFDFHPSRAYGNSLKKLLTTMSSGWFKYWMIDNFEDIKSSNYEEIKTKFNKAKQNGKLREDRSNET